MKVALLYNRRSGRGADPAVESRLVGGLRALGHEVVMLVPSARGQMTELARQAASSGGFGMVVAAGGDGTLNEVVNGCLGHPVPLGVVPLGTVNVWARCVGVPLDVDGALGVIAGGVPRPVTLGQVNGRAFTFAAGVGFDSEVISREDVALKKYIGRWSYYWKAVSTLATYRPPRLELAFDGELPQPAETVVFGKTYLYGDRFHLTPSASPFDAQVDACIFLRFDTFRFMKAMAAATHKADHLKEDYIAYRKFSRVRVSSPDPVHIQVDGEYMGRLPEGAGCEVAALPGAMQFVLPEV